jgi:hypothetical protein
MFFFLQILELTKRCQHIYMGLGMSEICLLRQTELKAVTLKILTLIKSDLTQQNQLDMKQNYLKLVKDLKRY